jgi:thiol-disulfide isomerase/thioredoxin
MKELRAETHRASRSVLIVGAWVAAAALSGVILASLWKSSPGPLANRSAESGLPLTHLELAPLVGDAEPLALADLRGKIVLLNLWGPWCANCQVEMPHLVRILAEWKGRADFRFVSVSCGQGITDDASQLQAESAAYLHRKDYHFDVHWDPDSSTRQAIATASGLGESGLVYPVTVVLDRQGTVRGAWSGAYVVGVERDMAMLVNRLLAES